MQATKPANTRLGAKKVQQKQKEEESKQPSRLLVVGKVHPTAEK